MVLPANTPKKYYVGIRNHLQKGSHTHKKLKGYSLENRRHPRRVRGRGPPRSGGRDSAKRVVLEIIPLKFSLFLADT